MSDTLYERAEQAFQKKDSTFGTLFEKCMDYVAPERKSWRNRSDTKSDMYSHIYDSTPINAAESLANSLTIALMPTYKRWATYTPGAEVLDPDERDNMLSLLEHVSDLLYATFQRTNLTSEANPAVFDALVSTGCIRVDADAKSYAGMRFKCIPFEELAFEEDEDGVLSTIFHKHKVPGRNLMARYSMKMSEDTKRVIREKPGEMVEVMRIQMPYGKQFRQYLYLCNDRKELLLDEVLDWQPMIAFRMSKIAGDVPYGRGPIMRALHDSRVLNKTQELAVRAGMLAVFPPMLVADDGVVNARNFRMNPGALTAVDSLETPPVAPLLTGADFQFTQFDIQNRRRDIKNQMFADRFGPPEGTPMTATEILQRSQIIAREMGAMIARIETELLFPLIQTVTRIMAKQGKMPKDMRVDRATVDVVFVSNLAQAQRAEDVDALQQFGAIVAGLAQLDPEASQVFNAAEAVRVAAENLQIPRRTIRSVAEVQKRMSDAAVNAQKLMGTPTNGQTAQPAAGTPV